MDNFQIFAYIVIAIIYLIYKSNNAGKKKKNVGNKPKPTPRRPAPKTTATSSSSSQNQELQSFLKELSKDLDKPTQEEKEYSPTTDSQILQPISDFAEIQEAQQEHARRVADERLSQAQKKRLGHARSVSTLSEEQQSQLEHAKSVTDSKKRKREKIMTNASDVRKAFIMSEVFKRKF
ncbi:hypothetical protein [Microscilla marina]|uniref:Uncharacterized protein n=1 Tax=Microscilla marina ATCC 23134 TaxID=313606 RepID=A1ZPX8_MICM2|nr:hypothetical protein [Microscilla marina]EAY27633.1 hypothetical protein M23134_02880 [Microscilla marina ATCC 23134]